MTLWRYMDLGKYTWMVQNKKLHFCRVDKFEDHFEGSYPLKNIDDFGSPGNGYSAEEWKKFVVVSCWYNSDYESDAMWRIYSLGCQGVAIKSSRERLERIIEADGYLKDVRYIDFIDEKADIKIPSDVVEYKRRAFIHENEVRAIITHYPHGEIQNGMPRNSEPIKGQEFPEFGHALDIDLSELIECVVVSPYAHDWYFDVVNRLADEYALPQKIVSWSRLKGDPVYAKI